MPELPEVETIVRELRARRIVGQKITGIVIRWPSLIQGCSVPAFKRLVGGARIRRVYRRGKFIVLALSNRQFLLIHLRMSGQFSLVKSGQANEPHQHITLKLSDGRELRYRDTRKFGRWRISTEPSRILGCLGPEPLENSFKPDNFRSLLKNRRRQLKPLLLDQHVIAGLGNIYVDEALWEARLHPRRLSDSLNVNEAARLFKAIRNVLWRAIRNKGTSLGDGKGNYRRLNMKLGRNQNKLRVLRSRAASCPRCGAGVKRILVGQRGTYICMQCQCL